MKILNSAIILITLLSAALSCQKKDIEPAEVYPPAPTPLVKFLDGQPSPNTGSVGTSVTFNVRGLEGKEGQFKFFINQSEAPVLSVTESTVTVRVPENASSGGSSVLINDEYYFGPSFVVRGKISIATDFNPATFQSSGPINGILRRTDNSGYFLIYGNFNNYNDQATLTNPITGLAYITSSGSYQPVANQLKMGRNGFPGGNISSAIQLPSTNIMVAGSFSRFDSITNVNSMLTFYSGGSLDTMKVEVINPNPENTQDNVATVPFFNGGVGGSVSKVFYDDATGYTVFGNFSNYVTTFYERSTKNAFQLDRISAGSVVRLKANGAFDSTFNYDRVNDRTYAGANGYISEAIKLADGNFLVVGNFTSFHGVQANYIAKISAVDGSVITTFNQGKAGADGNIFRITYNTSNQKILITGNFRNYNGQPANGVVMINADGTVDDSFKFRAVEGGGANFAGQLSDGKIIVSGSFNKYDNIVRPGLLILNSDGSLASGYNNSGFFSGGISQILQIDPAIPNGKTYFLVGYINRFDGKAVGNIVKINLEN